jgi:hypothetical protein
MRNAKLNARNVILLASAKLGLTFESVNADLRRRGLDPVNNLVWEVWTRFYLPLANTSVVYEKELIYNNRSLAWFANDLKRQYNKNIIS